MRELDQDELIDRWTLIGKDPELVATKRGAARRGGLRTGEHTATVAAANDQLPHIVCHYLR